MVEFYLLTFPRFPLQKKEHKSYFGKNRIHDLRTSRCAAYLLDHSGDAILMVLVNKVLQRPALVCGQVALGDIQCGRPQLGQTLAVCCV